MKKLQTRILLVLFTMMLIPQGMWAQVSTVITQTFNANSITTVTEYQATITALSAVEGGLWSVTGAAPSYNSGIQFTLEYQNGPLPSHNNRYPDYYVRFKPMTGSLNLVVDQIDLYFAAELPQNVTIDAANAGFNGISSPTTTSDGVHYQLQASSSQSASNVFFILTNNSYTSDETIVLKKIVMTGKATLDAPYLLYSYDSAKATFSNFTNYNGFLKGYYSIDYASASLADVTNTEYNGAGFGLQGPCIVTAYVQCGTAKSSNEIGLLFGFAESAMTTTYQPNGTVNAPNIVPDLPNDALIAYSNNTNETEPTNPINSSTGVITINGADTESYSASFVGTGIPRGMTVFNATNSNGAELSYKLGSFSLTVNKKSLTSDMIQDIPDQTYSGQNIAPGITVYDNGVYVPPTEYRYEANNFNAGTGTVTITALASSKKYTGPATKSFNILPRLLTANGTTYSLATDSYVYDGTAKTPAVNITVKKGEPMPALDTDYTVTYSDNTNVGTGKATITGKGNFTGTVEKSFTITAKSLSGAEISNIPDQTYTGNEIKPEPTVTLGSATLVKGTDFDFSYARNVNVPVTPNDVPTVTITGKGNYSGSATKTFNIVKATPTVTAPTAKSLTYNASAQALVNAGSTTAGTLQYSIDNQTYSTSIPSATNAGTYTVYYRVVGDGNINDVAAQSVTATIAKAAGAISFASTNVNKTFGDASFTNSLTKTGDGAVTYSSSNTNVATVNATSGEVTIVGNGSTVITATVTDGTNYTYAVKTATYTLSVGTAVMTVSATGHTGAYDGQAHGITVTAPAGATVKYGTSAGTYNLNASPTYTNAGSYTVYYEVTKANYTTVTGSAVVNISKASASISYATASVGKTFGDAPFTNALTKTGDGTVTYSSSNTNVATVNATSGEVTIVGNGSAVITATVTDGTNYTYAVKTATYTLSVGTAVMTVSATGHTGAYDGQAHGITVSAPAGATVKYGTSAGTYNLNASPTYTNAGSYTVYYEVTKANYTTVTGSAVVNISKASASISYATASVGKTFGDAPFTNALTKTGDGTVTYSSSNTNVATVNATSGEVTIVGNGSAVITATVTDGTNYTYAAKTVTYTLSVGTAAMTVNATGYTGAYDGQAHGITVSAPDGASVKYGESAGTYNLNASPTYINVGTYTVYYQVTKTGFNTVTGSATVTITKVDARVVYVDYEFTAKIGEPFDPPYLTLDPSDLVVTYYSADKDVATVDAQTGEVTLVSPGKVNIYAEFAGDDNYNNARDYYILTVLQRDIEPIDQDVVYTFDDEHFLYTDEDGNVKERKLDNTIIFDILFTLDTSGDPSESDGYDETEHCIVLNHEMPDPRLYNVIFMNLEPGSEEYAEEYTGLTFKVPAGTGYIIIDSRTDGENWMKVQIGDLAPVSYCHADREKDYIRYDCDRETWVHVYNGGPVNDNDNARMLASHRAKKTKGQVRIYSITRSSSTTPPDGIEYINAESLDGAEKWYDLQGNRIGRPMKKGIYILQGQKVIVR